MKTLKKKGLSQQFTREVRSSDGMEPSGFTVVPKITPSLDTEDPLEKIRINRLKEVKKEKKIKPKKEEIINRDKIKLVVDKLKFLEKKKQEKEIEEQNLAKKLQPISLKKPLKNQGCSI